MSERELAVFKFFGGDIMLFKNYRDINYTYDIPKTECKEIGKIKQEILNLLPKYKCEMIDCKTEHNQYSFTITKSSYFAINSGRVNMTINFVDDGNKVTVNARIKQNLFAAIILFIIGLYVFLMVSFLSIILFKTSMTVSIIIILFCIPSAYIFYRILNIKDSNAVSLEKLYWDICDKSKIGG